MDEFLTILHISLPGDIALYILFKLHFRYKVDFQALQCDEFDDDEFDLDDY